MKNIISTKQLKNIYTQLGNENIDKDILNEFERLINTYSRNISIAYYLEDKESAYFYLNELEKVKKEYDLNTNKEFIEVRCNYDEVAFIPIENKELIPYLLKRHKEGFLDIHGDLSDYNIKVKVIKKHINDVDDYYVVTTKEEVDGLLI